MRNIVILILAAVFSLTMLGADKPEKPGATTRSAHESDVKTNAPAHQGVWKPIAAVMGGERLPADTLKLITLKIIGSQYQVVVEGEEEPDKGTYTLDTNATPKRMTINSTNGPNRGKTILAIYEMKDAVSMRVCYDLSGRNFPEAFQAPKRTQLYLVGYRRQK